MNHSHCRVYVSVCSVQVKQVMWLILFGCYWWWVNWNVFCLVHTANFISTLRTTCSPNSVSLQSMALHVLSKKVKAFSTCPVGTRRHFVSDGEGGPFHMFPMLVGFVSIKKRKSNARVIFVSGFPNRYIISVVSWQNLLLSTYEMWITR